MEKLQKKRTTRLLHAQSEAWRWTAKDYRGTLKDHVHSMVQTLYPVSGAVYQDDNARLHTARLVKD